MNAKKTDFRPLLPRRDEPRFAEEISVDMRQRLAHAYLREDVEQEQIAVDEATRVFPDANDFP